MVEDPNKLIGQAFVESFVGEANRFSAALMIALLDVQRAVNPPRRHPRPAMQRHAKRRALRK